MTSNEVRAYELAKHIAGKNEASAKAFETNSDFQKLLFNLYNRAEQFANLKGTTIDKVGVSPNVLGTPSMERINFQFFIKD